MTSCGAVFGVHKLKAVCSGGFRRLRAVRTRRRNYLLVKVALGQLAAHLPAAMSAQT